MSNNIDETLSTAGAIVQRAGEEFDARRALIDADERLSPVGRAEHLGKISAERNAAITTAIDAASVALDREQARLQADLEAQRAAVAAADFEALGGVLVTQLIARDLAGMATAEIVDAAQQAPAHGPTKRLTQALALAELRDRQRRGDIEADIPLRQLQRSLEPATMAASRKELARLEAQRREVASWSPAYAAELASRFNIK